jgi:hypothetical protein
VVILSGLCRHLDDVKKKIGNVKKRKERTKLSAGRAERRKGWKQSYPQVGLKALSRLKADA